MKSQNKIQKKDYHSFKIAGDRILALASGEVYILDELAGALLESEAESEEEAFSILGNDFPPEDIKKAYREMNYILSHPIKDHSGDVPPRNLRALCLNITHKCNLACTYCFAEKLTEKNAVTMTWDVVKKSFDYLFEKSGGVDRLQVDFFGGEPLLAFDLVKQAVEYAHSLEKQYNKLLLLTLTTNATLLTDEILDFIRDNKISLILSLDGKEKIHDFYRRYSSGKGSFNIVLNNVNKVKEKLGKNEYYIRGTYTSQTMDILETLRFFHDQGFYNVSLEPVSSPVTTDYSFDETHLDTLLKEYLEAAKWMLDKSISFYHFNMEMDNPLCLTRRITGCGAGVEYMAVDPWGNLYPCHQFIENVDYKLGSVFTGIENPQIAEGFRESTIYGKNNCDDCWARFYCGGGCHYQQYSTMGSIKKPSPFYCKLFKGRLEIALWYNTIKKIKASKGH